MLVSHLLCVKDAMAIAGDLAKTLSAGLGVGGAPLGNLFRRVSDEAAVATIRHALESGVRYLDTAPHYGNGLSEHRYGRAVREVPRDSYALSTKVGRLLVADARVYRIAVPNHPKGRNMAPEVTLNEEMSKQ